MKRIGMISAVAMAMAMASNLAAASDRDLHCTLEFTSTEWSAVYASTIGRGTVDCKDGASMQVSIEAKGLGLTAGKWKITSGKGTFTHVRKIDDVLGSYVAVSGDIGVGKAGTARVLSKGSVSLALAGKGEGFDLGVAISSFRIAKLPDQPKK